MEKLRLTFQEQSDVLHQIADSLKFNNNYTRLNLKPKLEITEEEKKNIKYPTLLIDSEAYMKMFMLVDSTDNEISWHGLVNRNKIQNTYEIYDIVMFPQHNTAVHTGTDDDEYMGWLQEKMTNKDFPIKKMRLHGHSHVNMKTFASGDDQRYQELMVSDVQDGDFYIFMIVNKRREMSIFLYDYEQQILFTEREMTIEIVANGTPLIDWAMKNIKDYVTENSTQYKRKKVKKYGNRS